MKIYPDFYNQFQCVGMNCQNTCCAGWTITLDSETAQFYESQNNKFGTVLKQNITEIKGQKAILMTSENRCPFLFPASRFFRYYTNFLRHFAVLRREMKTSLQWMIGWSMRLPSLLLGESNFSRTPALLLELVWGRFYMQVWKLLIISKARTWKILNLSYFRHRKYWNSFYRRKENAPPKNYPNLRGTSSWHKSSLHTYDILCLKSKILSDFAASLCHFVSISGFVSQLIFSFRSSGTFSI